MFWRIESFPELQHLLPADRKRLVQCCVPRRVRWTMIVESLFFGGGPGALLGGGFVQGLNAPDILIGIAAAVGFAAGAALMYQVKLIRIRGQMRIHLEEVTQKQRLPMCLNCGYDHEGLLSDTCPECGMRLLPTDAQEMKRRD